MVPSPVESAANNWTLSSKIGNDYKLPSLRSRRFRMTINYHCNQSKRENNTELSRQRESSEMDFEKQKDVKTDTNTLRKPWSTNFTGQKMSADKYCLYRQWQWQWQNQSDMAPKIWNTMNNGGRNDEFRILYFDWHDEDVCSGDG